MLSPEKISGEELSIGVENREIEDSSTTKRENPEEFRSPTAGDRRGREREGRTFVPIYTIFLFFSSNESPRE